MLCCKCRPSLATVAELHLQALAKRAFFADNGVTLQWRECALTALAAAAAKADGARSVAHLASRLVAAPLATAFLGGRLASGAVVVVTGSSVEGKSVELAW